MAMHRYSLFRLREFRWILREDDPSDFAFPASSPFAKWSLLNPLVPPPEGVVPDSVSGRAQCIPIGEGRCLVSHRRLEFRCSVDDADAAFKEAIKLLHWLRFVTGQASLTADIAGHQISQDEARPPAPGPFSTGAAILPRLDIVDSALTFDRIRDAAAADPTLTVPVFGDLLLDAIEADGDDRKVILYSAIAVEAMAATRLAEMHAAAAIERPNDLRLVSISGPGGSNTQKDPVFTRLRENAKFENLLHELPLYVARRSLREDDQSLYQELLKLYKARNAVAHTGEIDTAKQLPLDYEGAKRALKAAVAAYKWFSAPGRYISTHASKRLAG